MVWRAMSFRTVELHKKRSGTFSHPSVAGLKINLSSKLCGTPKNQEIF